MKHVWPDKAQCVVVFTFDVDGISGALNRNPDARKFPSLISMREYGPDVAAPRILSLLNEYDIPASFYIPGYIAETHVSLVAPFRKGGIYLIPKVTTAVPTATCTSLPPRWTLPKRNKY